MIIYYKNLYQILKVYKYIKNKNLNLKSYISCKKVLLNSKYIKSK